MKRYKRKFNEAMNLFNYGQSKTALVNISFIPQGSGLYKTQMMVNNKLYANGIFDEDNGRRIEDLLEKVSDLIER
jgi:hypothetical protein